MNIVAHIYDESKSYEQLILAWWKLFLFPLRLILSLLILEPDLLCLYSSRFTMVFTGRIIQKDYNTFAVEWYLVPIVKRKLWHNMGFGAATSLLCILPLYKKEYGYSCWLTAEGDAVRYIPDDSAIRSKMNRKEFLLLTKQSELEFKCSESIKYTGC